MSRIVRHRPERFPVSAALPRTAFSAVTAITAWLRTALLRASWLSTTLLRTAPLLTAVLLTMEPRGAFGQIKPWRIYDGHKSPVISVAFSTNGSLALSGDSDGFVHVWSVRTGRLLRKWKAHDHSAYELLYSPEGKWVASNGFNQEIRLWQAGTVKNINTLFARGQGLKSLSLMLDGSLQAFGSKGNTIRLWDVSSDRLLMEFKGHEGIPHVFAYSRDRKTFLSGSYDHSLKLWDVASGREIRAFHGHKSWVSSVDLSPNGKLALSGSHDRTVRLWNVRQGKEVRRFRGHRGYVTSVKFSPDSRLALSTGSDDHLLRLWLVPTGEIWGVYAGHSQAVTQLAFSPNGRMILSGSFDNTARLWRVSRRKSQRRSFGKGQRPLGTKRLRSRHAQALEASQAKDPTRAAQIAREALNNRAWLITRKNQLLYNDLAQFLLRGKRFYEAAAVIVQIVKQVPGNPVSWYNLGDAYWMMGEKRNGARSYQTYAKLMIRAGKKRKIPKRVQARIAEGRKLSSLKPRKATAEETSRFLAILKRLAELDDSYSATGNTLHSAASPRLFLDLYVGDVNNDGTRNHLLVASVRSPGSSQGTETIHEVYSKTKGEFWKPLYFFDEYPKRYPRNLNTPPLIVNDGKTYLDFAEAGKVWWEKGEFERVQ